LTTPAADPGNHAPTVTINVPLNNRLQTVDVAATNAAAHTAARNDFEPRWNQLISLLFNCFWRTAEPLLARRLVQVSAMCPMYISLRRGTMETDKHTGM
jgi:uncharacterized membrane protein